MKKIAIFILFLFSVSILYAQDKPVESSAKTKNTRSLSPETVSAEAIDNLILGDPNVSRHIGSTGKSWLSLLRNLVRTAGQRKHEQNLRQDIIVQGGEQAQFFGKDGNYFIFYKGKVHPISNYLINKAKEKNSFLNLNKIGNLPNYDWNLIRENFIPKRKNKTYEYFLTHEEESIDYISKTENCPSDSISFRFVYTENKTWYYEKGPIYYVKDFKVLTRKKNPKPLKQYGLRNDGKHYAQIRQFKFSLLAVEITISNSLYDPLVNHLLTYGWERDFNGNKRKDLDEFQGLARSFYEDEIFHISWEYQSEVKKTFWELIIYAQSGIVEYLKEKCFENVCSDEHQITSWALSPGRYVINLQVKDALTGDMVTSDSERFEILPRKTKTSPEED